MAGKIESMPKAPGHLIDLTGKRFGKLTVIKRHGTLHNGAATWICRCDCGESISPRTTTTQLLHRTRCCAKCRSRKYKNATAAFPREYRSWKSAIRRCHDRTDDSFHKYGARGIRVCARWRKSFDNFFSDMGPRPEAMSLGRIDNDGDYTKKNCRWETLRQQANNTRTNRRLTLDGKTQTLTQWARDLGCSYQCVQKRIDEFGWSLRRALTEPPQPRT